MNDFESETSLEYRMNDGMDLPHCPMPKFADKPILFIGEESIH